MTDMSVVAGKPAVWDVFISHCHTDEVRAAALATALSEYGLRVFRAIGALDPFTSISDSVLAALRNSRLLLACYSSEYPTRTACQYEFASAYLTGEAEGDPLKRVIAINFERTLGHIEPRHLRDRLLPTLTATPSSASLASVVKAVADSVAKTSGVMGQVPERPAQWIDGAAIHPPNHFAGRWRELWWLHSALHPNFGPLTSQPTAAAVVVHGPVGIGKTALATQYIRRFGTAFPGGVVWRSAHRHTQVAVAPSDCLWVLDDVEGEADQVAANMPSDLATPCLVLTRDPALAKLGNALALDDLSTHESAQLITTHGAINPVGVAEITTATTGSPELRSRVAQLAGARDVDVALETLYRAGSPVLTPLTERLRQVLLAATDVAWDILRILAVASPAAVSVLHIADVLGCLRGTDRLREFTSVQNAVTELLTCGVVRAEPNAIEIHLEAGVALAVRQLDTNPRRADTVRAQTFLTIVNAGSTGQPLRPRLMTTTNHATTSNHEQAQAAHRIRTELLHRITGHPLPGDAGSLREALNSLYELLKTVRTTYGTLPPRSLHTTPSGVNLGVVIDDLLNNVLRSRLAHWHIELAAHEDIRPPEISRIEHERRWSGNDKLREDLLLIHQEAAEIAEQLAVVIDDSSS